MDGGSAHRDLGPALAREEAELVADELTAFDYERGAPAHLDAEFCRGRNPAVPQGESGPAMDANHADP